MAKTEWTFWLTQYNCAHDSYIELLLPKYCPSFRNLLFYWRQWNLLNLQCWVGKLRVLLLLCTYVRFEQHLPCMKVMLCHASYLWDEQKDAVIFDVWDWVLLFWRLCVRSSRDTVLDTVVFQNVNHDPSFLVKKISLPQGHKHSFLYRLKMLYFCCLRLILYSVTDWCLCMSWLLKLHPWVDCPLLADLEYLLSWMGFPCVCPRGGGACVCPIGRLVCPGDTVPFFIIGSNSADVLKCNSLVFVHFVFCIQKLLFLQMRKL